MWSTIVKITAQGIVGPIKISRGGNLKFAQGPGISHNTAKADLLLCSTSGGSAPSWSGL